jgi:2,3-bisphosphoglycerate-independent phosphoglycerate mutase
VKTLAYGEDQPRLRDDRLPVVLVLLDGLGDRAVPELGMRTPSEAARTPVLDRLTARGASGWHVPFGWGRAPSSELAHWAMFGYGSMPFPGRAVLEALGAGIELPCGEAVTFASLRTSREVDGKVWITGRTGQGDEADAQMLLSELAAYVESRGAVLQPMGRGEALLRFPAFASGAVSDSDPFFEHLHPWMRVQATQPQAAAFAATLNNVLIAARGMLQRSAVNQRRRANGQPAIDVLSTKWSGARVDMPGFAQLAGVEGAMVTDSRLYRGMASLLGMRQQALPVLPDAGADMSGRLEAALHLIEGGAQFVHVHTKATDEAGHTKRPRAKLEVLESLDAALNPLESLADRAIVVITGDHATPSVNGVLHTGDPTPLLLLGPTIRADEVTEFGEASMRKGWFGRVAADELLPLLLSHANRPMFLGHRAGARQTLAVPDSVESMPLRPQDE